MKRSHSRPWLLLAIATSLLAHADINLPISAPAEGSDGDLILTNSGARREVIIDLRKARNGAWNSPQSQPLDSILGGVGTYDGSQWAVVFKYNSIRIEQNVTVRFINHLSRAPVVWLVSGSVEIDGEVNLDGGTDNVGIPEPGPGGFRGPAHGLRGYLVVDGFRLSDDLIPLLGGAGRGNSGGGGALLLASCKTIRLGGVLSARPGLSGNRFSGGNIRIVADTLDLGPDFRFLTAYSSSFPGMTRLEVNRLIGEFRSDSVPSLGSPGNPVKLWPASADPRVRIVRVDDAEAPAEPLALGSPSGGADGQVLGPDITIRKFGKSRILIETENFPPSTEAKVILFASAGRELDGAQGIPATLQPGGNRDKAHWVVELELPRGTTSLQVNAVAGR